MKVKVICLGFSAKADRNVNRSNRRAGFKMRFTQLLQNQGERYFHLWILGKSHLPIPLITETVRPSLVLLSRMRNALEENYRRYCLPAHEVDLQIETLRQELLASAEDIEFEQMTPDVFGE